MIDSIFFNYMGGQGALAMTVEVRRQLPGVSSLLPPYGSPRLNSDCKASKQKLFSSRPAPSEVLAFLFCFCLFICNFGQGLTNKALALLEVLPVLFSRGRRDGSCVLLTLLSPIHSLHSNENTFYESKSFKHIKVRCTGCCVVSTREHPRVNRTV